MGDNDISGAIDRIVRLANDAAKTTILSANSAGEPPEVYFIVGPDGKHTKHVAAPPHKAQKLSTPLQLRQFILDQGGTSGIVYLSDKAAIFQYDKETRRDYATCVLSKSPQFVWAETGSGKTYRQPDFVRILRIILQDCLGVDSALLSLVRQLKFTSGGEAEGTIQHGKESLGKQITNAVTGQAALPEEIILTMQVFDNHPFRAKIACALEIFPAEASFKITPYPMEVKKAMDTALDDIVIALHGKEMPNTYIGSPA
jgi:hypothetical protein